MMTGTSVDIEFEGAASDLITNKTLYDVMYQQILEIGMPDYTIEDEQYAQAIFNTFTPEVQAASLVGLRKEDAKQLQGKVIADHVPACYLNLLWVALPMLEMSAGTYQPCSVQRYVWH